MKIICMIALALAVSVSTAVGNSCTGRKNGEQIPNTSDCGSYYVCDYGTPSLFHCGGGLLYDHKLGVCNWASSVSCGQLQGHEQKPPTSPPTTPKPPTIPPTTTPAQVVNPYPNWPVHTPDSIGDYYPGIQENKNSPLGYQCTIDGFYFAPHPYICEQYFICENRRIHFHQCGAGIHWDYIYLQCDFPERSYCYSNNTQNNNNYNPPANLPVSGSPPVFIGVTAPVAIELPIHFEIETSTVVPTTTEVTTTTTTTEATTTSTQEAEEDPAEATVVCPEDQAFMAHADCHKYYICISTLAISISCPDHMAWDDSIMQCTEDALAKCHF